MGGELNMDESSIRNVAQIDWHGNGIDLEAHLSTSADVWDNWNADLLDGYHAAAFVQKAGDTMTGDFSLAGSLILLPTTEAVLNPGFQTDGDVTMHWMTESGTYFKYGATGGEGDRFHFGSDGEFKAWGNVYSLADLVADRDLAVGGQGRVQYDPEIGTNQYALWVRNFGATYNDARGLLVTTPEYSGGAGIIFHAASKAGQSMASRFIVGTDGNVGIGVNDPQNRLHVAGDARLSGDLLMMDGQNILSPNFNPGTWGSGYDAWGPNAYLKYGFVRELLVAQNSDFLGKVKIGTESDYAQLNVGAPTNLVTPTYAARFESELGDDSDLARGVLINFPHTTNGNSILFHAMSGPGPYTNSRVVIKADGKVGIGTSYPEATLHVHGDLRVDGAFAGDGSGLTNLPVAGLSTNAADARYVNVSGDTMTGSLVVAGGISSAGFTLTNSGATSLNMVYDGDYSVLRNAYSEIWFGTPYDPSLWFNYAAGTNVYFGDVNNLQNICMYGDLHVSGTINGDGSGLINLPVTGLTTNEADVRYFNAAGDMLTGTLNLGGQNVTNAYHVYGTSSDLPNPMWIVAGARTSGVGPGGDLNLSGGPGPSGYGNVNILNGMVAVEIKGTTNRPSGDVFLHAGSGTYAMCSNSVLRLAGGINPAGVTTGWIRIESRMDANGQIISNALFVGDGSGLTNLPVTGLTSNEADARYATVTQGALADTALQPGTAITVASVHILGNSNAAPGSVVAGGSNNLAGTNSFVGGGQYNYGIADYSVVAGGYANMAYAPYSAILGGQYNRASGTCSVVVGGYNNSILSNSYSQYSSIVGGNGNSIQRGSYSFVGGGYGNVVNYTGPSYGGAFIGGGYSNRVAGRFSMIPGGYANVASGLYSFAAGSFANAGHQSAFVWSDSSSGNPFSSTQPNQFLIRATGGVGINTNGTWGKALTVAGDVEVAGTGRFTVGLLVPQQGDISMGSYTNGTF